MGQEATKLLLSRLSEEESGEPREIVLPVKVIVRKSCGPAPSKRRPESV